MALRSSAFAFLTLLAASVAQQAAAATPELIGPCGVAIARNLPMTRCYRIEPDFCPQQLAVLIPRWVPDGTCATCGPYGVPPIYVSGSWLVIRQTREAHALIAEHLIAMGAMLPPKRPR